MEYNGWCNEFLAKHLVDARNGDDAGFQIWASPCRLRLILLMLVMIGSRHRNGRK